MSARLAIMRAARQLATEAGVHVHVRNFCVINQVQQCIASTSTTIAATVATAHTHARAQVGAVSIDARLDCDAFASTHSATSHYDRASFVGLAWRPMAESICCGALFLLLLLPRVLRTEIFCRCSPCMRRNLQYRCTLLLPRLPPPPPCADHHLCVFFGWFFSGRANLPGSTRERDLLGSFSRMLPELLRHSDRQDVLALLKDELKEAHRPKAVQRDDATAQDDEAAAIMMPTNDLMLTQHAHHQAVKRRRGAAGTTTTTSSCCSSSLASSLAALPPLTAVGPGHRGRGGGAGGGGALLTSLWDEEEEVMEAAQYASAAVLPDDEDGEALLAAAGF